MLLPHSVLLHVSFSHLSLERGTELSESGIWTGSGWPFVHSLCRKQALLNDVLIPWYCMFIKHNNRYKQENAIVPSRKWSRNTGGPQTMDWSSFLHCESVGQKKAHCSRVKIGEIIVWFTLPPCSSDPNVGHIGSGQHGEEKMHRFTQIFSHLLSEQLHPPSHSPSLSYLTQLIETLYGKIRPSTIQPFYE